MNTVELQLTPQQLSLIESTLDASQLVRIYYQLNGFAALNEAEIALYKKAADAVIAIKKIGRHGSPHRASFGRKRAGNP